MMLVEFFEGFGVLTCTQCRILKGQELYPGLQDSHIQKDYSIPHVSAVFEETGGKL
jgi:hypothetical protein